MPAITKTPYLPTHYTGCQLWMDGKDSSSMTLSGSTVTAWNDKSGNSNVTSSHGGSPQLTSGGIALSISSSPGDNFQFATLNNPPSGALLTIFVVATINSSTVSSWQYGRIVSFGDGTSSDFGADTFTICQSGASEAVSLYRNGGNIFNHSITYGIPFLISLVWDGTNVYGYFNGTSLGSVSSSGNFGFISLGLGVNIATGSYPNDCLEGVLSEIIMFYSALSTADRQQIELYLARKWGLPYSQKPAADIIGLTYNAGALSGAVGLI